MSDQVSKEIALRNIDCGIDEIRRFKRRFDDNRSEIRRCFWGESAQYCYKGVDAIEQMLERMERQLSERKIQITIEKTAENML